MPVQVRTLSELGWFLSLGTVAQLFALVVVVVKLFMSPIQGKRPHVAHSCCWKTLCCRLEAFVLNAAASPNTLQLCSPAVWGAWRCI